MSGRFCEQRGTAFGVMVGAVTFGSATPHLINTLGGLDAGAARVLRLFRAHWELYAMWAWISAFLTAENRARGDRPAGDVTSAWAVPVPGDSM